MRFLPPPEERPASLQEERENLAEVIEFRTRLRRPEASAAPGSGSPSAPVSRVPPAERLGEGLADERAVRIARLSEEIEMRLGERLGEEALPADAPESKPQRRGLSVRSETKLLAVEAEQSSAHDLAIKLLSRRALSSGELRRALGEAGHPELDIEEAVAECEESLYLDDAALARSVVQKLRESKGESRGRILQKLRERLLPDEAIGAALDELDDDEELVLLRQTAEDRARRLGGLDRQTAERRLLGFLARRGWAGERASRAVREALDGIGLVGTGLDRGAASEPGAKNKARSASGAAVRFS